MRKALAEMLSSKKMLLVLAAIALAAIQGALTKLGAALPSDTYLAIEACLGAGLAAQAVADHGKEAAKIAAAAPSPSSVAIAVAPTPPEERAQ